MCIRDRLKEAELRDQRARKMGLLEEVRTQRSVAMRALSEEARTQQAFTQYAASTVSGAPDTVLAAYCVNACCVRASSLSARIATLRCVRTSSRSPIFRAR